MTEGSVTTEELIAGVAGFLFVLSEVLSYSKCCRENGILELLMSLRTCMVVHEEESTGSGDGDPAASAV